MKVKILGVQNVDYVSKRTNQPVSGITLHAVFSDAQVKGQAVDQIFVSDNLHIPSRRDIAVGQTVDIEYNSRGRVCGLEIVPEAPGK